MHEMRSFYPRPISGGEIDDVTSTSQSEASSDVEVRDVTGIYNKEMIGSNLAGNKYSYGCFVDIFSP